MIRGLFVGGVVDNTEIDLDPGKPPMHYPPDSGGGQSRYRLRQVGRGKGGEAVCAVYGAPDTPYAEVARVSDERDYARRFEVELEEVEGE
ncbi:hypothetical protein Psesu_2087 [Pseudoxanthomonas suwonensis 11-1]|uniref:Uncharacterized protein n=1 Tax=Pseudoxanthomonas suwonensis (strain 11-1) TaxID=743721 RepID=E6WUD9_PSEUU|nr:hypothetical protein Psesu_2087 [Pseudoxanthomonas suwonensis 11-1]